MSFFAIEPRLSLSGSKKQP